MLRVATLVGVGLLVGGTVLSAQDAVSEIPQGDGGPARSGAGQGRALADGAPRGRAHEVAESALCRRQSELHRRPLDPRILVDPRFGEESCMLASLRSSWHLSVAPFTHRQAPTSARYLTPTAVSRLCTG